MEKTVENLLKEYNQEHVIKYMKSLNDKDREKIEKQIEGINFKELKCFYDRVQTKREKKGYEIKPLDVVDKSKITEKEQKEYTEIGEKVLENNEFAVITMAGGQGTRLRT